MNAEEYRKAVITRIRREHRVVLKKGIPAKKSPTGKAVKPEVKWVHGVTSAVLLGKALLNKFRDGNQSAAEAELGKMRAEGLILCTNGMWWVR